MPEFDSKKPYLKQLLLYFKNGSHKEAYSLSEEFVRKFPKEMASHFFLARSAFWLNDYVTARDESLKAFNLSNGEDEMAVAGILLACSYYRLRDYPHGIEVLNLLRTDMPQREDLPKLKFVFALALNDEVAAMKHLETLYEINENAASNLIVKVLEQYI